MKKAMSRIGARSRSRISAFTMIEIMIVVLIIGILLAIAVPNFVHARETTRAKACVGNLRRIQFAKDSWLMDNNLPITSTPTEAQIYGATGYIRATPQCPSSGSYTINSGSQDPTCSTGGWHNIDQLVP